MSREVKYIGMDVHKEAIVIAVQNTRGHLVMESVVETKSSSILQFIHGLQGELHVTWEKGTWAAWLYDLLKPHVHQVLVCDPRRNALLKECSKNDKVDAGKLANLLRTGMLRPVYHGEHGLRTLRELARTYQTLSQDLNRVMNRLKAWLGHWLWGYAGLCTALSRGMARQDRARGGAPASRTALSTVGRIAGHAANAAPGVIGGEPKTQSRETAAADSLHRSDSGSPIARVDANPAPIPEQATTVDLQWAGHRNAR